MKNCFSIGLIFILSLTIFSGASARNLDYTDQGNGGDFSAAEFIQIGLIVKQFLQLKGQDNPDFKKLFEVMETAVVESTDLQLYINDLPKDAINLPEKRRIIFNRLRWEKFSFQAKAQLVLHEYFGLAGISDETYAASKLYLRGLKQCDGGVSTRDFKNTARAWSAKVCQEENSGTVEGLEMTTLNVGFIGHRDYLSQGPHFITWFCSKEQMRYNGTISLQESPYCRLKFERVKTTKL